jgi:hypothetical protein
VSGVALCRTAAQAISLTVAGPELSVPVPAAEAGAEYRHELTMTGGTAPHEWRVSDGRLPDGLTLDPAT